MIECSGYVSKIETLGLLDGPGVRVVVFLSGCRLRCLYCHNPEMWQVSGRKYTVGELVSYIKRFRAYFKDNGGVTFSGGEPLFQSDFLLGCLMELKKEGIDTCIDTAGVGLVNDLILDYVDLVLLDIKAVDDDMYRYITGYDIKESNEFINKISNKRVWIRQVILPGINDNMDYINKLALFIRKIPNVDRVELLPYHTMGVVKYEELGIDYPLDIDEMSVDVCNILQDKLIELLK